MRINNFFYVDAYKMIAGAIDGKLRSGLVNKIAGFSVKNKESKLFAKSIYLAAKVKYYILTGIPAAFLWLFGKATKRKNGIIYIEVS